MIKNYSLLYLVATASLSTSAYLRNEKVLEDSYGYASTDMAVGATNTMNQVYDKQELPSPNSEDNEEFDEFVEMDEYEMDDLDNETPEEEGSSYDHEESNEVVENGIMPRSQFEGHTAVGMLLDHCYSFESFNFRSHNIRHRNLELWMDPFNNSELFRLDHTFKMVTALDRAAGQVSFMSINSPGRYMGHTHGLGSIHGCGVSDVGWRNNVSWYIHRGLSGTSTVSFHGIGGYFRHQDSRMKFTKHDFSHFYGDDDSLSYPEQLLSDDASFIPHEVPCF